jgi:hypothetical protein
MMKAQSPITSKTSTRYSLQLGDVLMQNQKKSGKATKKGDNSCGVSEDNTKETTKMEDSFSTGGSSSGSDGDSRDSYYSGSSSEGSYEEEKEETQVKKPESPPDTTSSLKRSESITMLMKHSDQAQSSSDNSHPAQPNAQRRVPVRIASGDLVDVRPSTLTADKETLIECVVDLLQLHIKRIVAHRKITNAINGQQEKQDQQPPDLSEFIAAALSRSMMRKPGGMTRGRPKFSIIDQQSEVIEFPKAPSREVQLKIQEAVETKVKLSEKVVDQLRIFVQEISKMYHDNPFHNFQHGTYSRKYTTTRTRLLLLHPRILIPIFVSFFIFTT